MENNKVFYLILAGILLLAATKKSSKPYHSEVYSSWEEEQIDEMRADLNYLEEKLEGKHKY